MFLHIQKLGQQWKPETSVRGSEEQTEQRENPSGEAEGGEAMNVITEEQIEELMRAETRTQPADLGERKRAIRKLSGYVRELRKSLGWVNNEIHCLNKARRPPVSGKLRVFRRRLIKMYGSSCLQGRRLHAISYKLKGLVRVKTNQLRRKQRSLHMTEQTRAFQAKGPGIFGGKRSRPQLTEQQAQAMKLFWTDIWERDGVYSRSQRDLKKWRKAVKYRISMGTTTDSTMHMESVRRL